MRYPLAILVAFLLMAGPSANQQSTASAEEAIQALRTVGSVVGAGVTFGEYQARIIDAKIIIDRYLSSSATGDANVRTAINRALDYYMLARDAWWGKVQPASARSDEDVRRDRELGNSPLLSSCRPFQATLTKAGRQLFDNTFGRSAMAQMALSDLWQCASERTTAAQTALAGSPAPTSRSDEVEVVTSGLVYHLPDCPSLRTPVPPSSSLSIVSLLTPLSKVDPRAKPCPVCRPSDGGTNTSPTSSAPEGSDFVYLMAGGVIYHRRDCVSLSGHTVVAKRLAELGPRNEPCSSCQPLAKGTLPSVRQSLSVGSSDSQTGAPTPPSRPQPSGITMAAYLRLRSGMSYSDAVDVIGDAGTETSRSEIGGISSVMYMWQNATGGNISAIFTNGKLATKAQFGLQ